MTLFARKHDKEVKSFIHLCRVAAVSPYVNIIHYTDDVYNFSIIALTFLVQAMIERRRWAIAMIQ